MFKTLFIFLAGMVLVKDAYTQTTERKTDTLVYYLKKNGNMTVKENSDLMMLVMPNDTKNKKNLYPVIQFYRNGKRRLIASSSTHSINVIFEGPYRTFFSNGHLESTSIYKNGHVVGPVTEYYPNGKVYTIKNYDNYVIKYLTCNDSTGAVLTENGNGIWREFDANFKKLVKQAHILHGDLSDQWQPIVDTSDYAYYDKTGPIEITADNKPQFSHGDLTFQLLLSENLNYPKKELKNGIAGRVTLSMIIEKDGTLTHLKILQTPSTDLGEEAIRLIKLSMPWTPGSMVSDMMPLRLKTIFKLDFFCLNNTTGVVQPVFDTDISQYIQTSKSTLKQKLISYADKNDKKYENMGDLFSNFSLDQPPVFPGGLQAFGKFLSSNILYPAIDRANGVSGKVIITYIVELDGRISHLRASGPTQAMTDEAIRVIKRSPTWTPGIKNGRQVRSIHTVPIDFTTE